MKLGEQIGSKIISLNVPGTTIIVLNDKDDAANLLDKRSTVYSDRNCPPMVQDSSLFGWGDFGSLVGYGDRWRKYRRRMNPWLTKQAVALHHESQEHATRKLLRRLLDSGKDVRSSQEVEAELFLSVSATLLRSIYGYEAENANDRFLIGARSIFSYLTKSLLSSNYLVNSLPALKYVPEWFPGASWKRDAIKWKMEKDALIQDMYNVGLENMRKDESSHIMVSSLRRHALQLGLTEQEADDYVAQIAITMFAGGADTVYGQYIAHVSHGNGVVPGGEEEGPRGNRLPKIEDRDQLGYVDRIVQETLRWVPVTPMAVPHACFQDDTYNGYHIPKGAIVIGNAWAITRDETVYANPEAFDPDRYLDPATPPSPVFGWGRRRCPGVHFAQASLFIAITSILMAFDIEAIKDENGEDLLPSRKMINALVLIPEPFVFKLTPRSESHEELMRQSL
ncbi:unnamed protein product [Rhizoctonia solani]|nr:unnamed protein product [Rhizoctonia solani]